MSHEMPSLLYFVNLKNEVRLKKNTVAIFQCPGKLKIFKGKCVLFSVDFYSMGKNNNFFFDDFFKIPSY